MTRKEQIEIAEIIKKFDFLSDFGGSVRQVAREKGYILKGTKETDDVLEIAKILLDI